jgi:hypothetical protein
MLISATCLLLVWIFEWNAWFRGKFVLIETVGCLDEANGSVLGAARSRNEHESPSKLLAHDLNVHLRKLEVGWLGESRTRRFERDSYSFWLLAPV